MDQNGGAFVGTMLQEGNDAGIVEVLLSNVIADLHAQMPSTHASAQLFAGCVDVLQRNLTERLQTSLSVRAQLKRRVVKEAGAVQRVLRGPVIGEEYRRRRED